MTQVDTTPPVGAAEKGAAAAPSRFGLVLLAAVIVPVVALYPVPQPVFSTFGLLAVAVVVVGGAAAVGAAVAVVLRSASARSDVPPSRGANVYFAAAGLCFFTLCLVAPTTVIIGANGLTGAFQYTEPRDLLMAAVAGAGLLLGAVLAVVGAVLVPMRSVRRRLAWAKADLAAQVFALGAVLAVVAILY